MQMRTEGRDSWERTRDRTASASQREVSRLEKRLLRCWRTRTQTVPSFPKLSLLPAS